MPLNPSAPFALRSSKYRICAHRIKSLENEPPLTSKLGSITHHHPSIATEPGPKFPTPRRSQSSTTKPSTSRESASNPASAAWHAERWFLASSGPSQITWSIPRSSDPSTRISASSILHEIIWRWCNPRLCRWLISCLGWRELRIGRRGRDGRIGATFGPQSGIGMHRREKSSRRLRERGWRIGITCKESGRRFLRYVLLPKLLRDCVEYERVRTEVLVVHTIERVREYGDMYNKGYGIDLILSQVWTFWKEIPLVGVGIRKDFTIMNSCFLKKNLNMLDILICSNSQVLWWQNITRIPSVISQYVTGAGINVHLSITVTIQAVKSHLCSFIYSFILVGDTVWCLRTNQVPFDRHSKTPYKWNISISRPVEASSVSGTYVASS